MSTYDNRVNESFTLYNGARGIYHIAKAAIKGVADGVKKAVSPKPTVPVEKSHPKTQSLQVPPKTQAEKNQEYKAKMDEQYGSGVSDFVLKMFGSNKI